MSHAEGIFLSLVLPTPKAALHEVDAAVTSVRHHLPPSLSAALRCSTLKVWEFTVLSCPEESRFLPGKTYAAIDFGLRPPMEFRAGR